MLKKLSTLAAGLLLSATVWATPTIELTTSMGKITVELSGDKAPKSTANFLQYAKSGFYNGTIFHRVIPGFMIQGGGFDAKMSQKATNPPIENEAKNGLRNQRGTLAMARTGDPHSATAQFFINHQDNEALDYPSRDGWGYAVFGKVTQGMDIVDKIAQVPTGSAGMHQNVPRTPIVIESVKITSEK
jgi:cyclophilin family peptidyl-prolyl cis-trans isomerase